MKSRLVLISVLITTTHFIYAQRNCGTMELYNIDIVKDSLFRSNRKTINILNQRFIINNEEKSLKQLDVTIPVVIHVVMKNNPRQISKDQIMSQLKVLNDDFGSMNADLNQVPQAFRPVTATDIGIRFALAIRDPNGNPTDGIEYIQTPITAFEQDNNVKFKALGGADAWPPDQYLNIWVCNLSSNLLGYAQFPGGRAATDGVVINYTAFGVNGTAIAPFNKGRTATHELGHWLDLYHIWGDDNVSCTGTDRIDDTPNQAGPNYNRPNFPTISCNNGPNGDMFMNYMDYVDDNAMLMFSKAQALRIRSTLQNFRSRFFTSSGLIDPKVQLSAEKPSALIVY